MDASVTLICDVPLLNGIEKRKDVAYKIEWFAEEGESLKTEERCRPAPGRENAGPCPNTNSLNSRLPGNEYKIGQRVSKVKLKLS